MGNTPWGPLGRQMPQDSRRPRHRRRPSDRCTPRDSHTSWGRCMRAASNHGSPSAVGSLHAGRHGPRLAFGSLYAMRYAVGSPHAAASPQSPRVMGSPRAVRLPQVMEPLHAVGSFGRTSVRPAPFGTAESNHRVRPSPLRPVRDSGKPETHWFGPKSKMKICRRCSRPYL